MKFNCVPDTKPFHAARKNFTFLSLLLLLLFIILVPIGYSFTRYVNNGKLCSYICCVGYNQVLIVVHLEEIHSCTQLLMKQSVI